MSEAAVVDASVALAWVLPAEGTEQALRLREEAVARPAFALLAPSLFWYEVGNVLWRAARQGRMAEDAAMSALDALERFAIETRHVRAAACLELALAEGSRSTMPPTSLWPWTQGVPSGRWIGAWPPWRGPGGSWYRPDRAAFVGAADSLPFGRPGNGPGSQCRGL
jgi:predicted nucleic acid-binding protein